MSLRTKIIKKLVAVSMSDWSKGTIQAQRARQERTARYTRLARDIQCQPVDADGVPAEWIRAPADRSKAIGVDGGAILYLHGGAYALGSINVHRELVARLARATNTRVLAIDYRLAPEHPYPAALEDATTAYLWLIDEGIAPSQLIVAGDSAGGGLALAALVALRDAGKPLPAGAVCLSPWTDLALTGASVQTKAGADPILDPDDLKQYARFYAREHDLASPRISPLYADLQGLPPLLIQVGTDEILLDDALRCAGRARRAGVDVTLDVCDGMFHVFQMFPFLPETTQAVGRIAEFVLQWRAPGGVPLEKKPPSHG
ncbi:MAG: alpha/beta hydrolase [Anaerolineae bacterium]|nr:alpha/beta hydrolase [Anaerolineae bacterium]